jgi:hypothetical protein
LNLLFGDEIKQHPEASLCCVITTPVDARNITLGNLGQRFLPDGVIKGLQRDRSENTRVRSPSDEYGEKSMTTMIQLPGSVVTARSLGAWLGLALQGAYEPRPNIVLQISQ